ncbi:MAG TPA: ABC transporter permease, partial [Candidatus Limnocylindrales bacterium]
MLGIPVGVLLFFTSTSIVVVPGGRPADVLVPGSIALAIIATALVNLGIATAYERSYGVLKRLGGSPLGRTGLFAAKVGVIGLIVLVQVVVLLAVAVGVVGWSAGGVAPPSVPVTAIAIVLGTAAFAGLGLLLAGTLRAEGTLAIANGLFLAAMLLGGVILPVSHLAEPLAAVAGILPAAALSEMLAIGLGTVAGDATRPFAVLVVWAVATGLLTLRTFRWE